MLFIVKQRTEKLLASHVDVLRGSSRVPAPQTSADLSGKKRRPITADFQIAECTLDLEKFRGSVISRKDQKGLINER